MYDTLTGWQILNISILCSWKYPHGDTLILTHMYEHKIVAGQNINPYNLNSQLLTS